MPCCCSRDEEEEDVNVEIVDTAGLSAAVLMTVLAGGIGELTPPIESFSVGFC
jgi:hypothetical protein